MPVSPHRPNSCAFVGFGEAAQAFVTGWADVRPGSVRAYDINPDKSADCTRLNVINATSMRDAVGQAECLFSVVTADQALAAAQAVTALKPGTLWFDCNSCAPDTKRAAAKHIEAIGGCYVDVAVMAPVHPKLHHVPLLVSGPHAQRAAAVLQALDMKPRTAGSDTLGDIGRASSIKMMRSVMIKGMEALTAECFLAARQAGVEDEVIGSLEASNPEIHWREQGAYNLERMMVHGARRAAEMEEVALTVQQLGLPNRLSAAIAAWQGQVAQTQTSMATEQGTDELTNRLDHLLPKLRSSIG